MIIFLFIDMLHQNAEWIAHTVRWLKYWLLTCWGLKCLMFDHFLSLLHQNAEWITRSVRCWPCQSCAWSWQPVGNHGGLLHSLHHPLIIILYYITIIMYLYYIFSYGKPLATMGASCILYINHASSWRYDEHGSISHIFIIVI